MCSCVILINSINEYRTNCRFTMNCLIRLWQANKCVNVWNTQRKNKIQRHLFIKSHSTELYAYGILINFFEKVVILYNPLLELEVECLFRFFLFYFLPQFVRLSISLANRFFFSLNSLFRIPVKLVLNFVNNSMPLLSNAAE